MDLFPCTSPCDLPPCRCAALVPEDFPVPEAGVEYPLIGVVDSGTAADDPYLSPWRHARQIYVPEADQDNSHGSFVSGLIIHSRSLNHDDSRFPSCSARFVDIVALAKNGTTEDKLLTTLEDAVEKYPEVKVWNLSLGTERAVDNKSFSDLGVALDRLQDERNITFILAAGNYHEKPFRGWPPDDLGESDRICAPADSVRAIVVGAVAHRDHSSSRVKAGNPSPFHDGGPVHFICRSRSFRILAGTAILREAAIRSEFYPLMEREISLRISARVSRHLSSRLCSPMSTTGLRAALRTC